MCNTSLTNLQYRSEEAQLQWFYLYGHVKTLSEYIKIRQSIANNENISDSQRTKNVQILGISLLSSIALVTSEIFIGVGCTTMVAMGVLSAPAALAMTIVPIIIGLCHSILQSNILENTKGLLFTSSIDLPEIRMIIDPSGYVYDLNTGKMIKNAIVSIHYFTDDENSTGIPADNDYGILWEAPEWNQTNPNLTAENGAYAWDVPNGWWRIKCEKK